MRATRFRSGPRRQGDWLVGLVTGGEPDEGCDPVAILLACKAEIDFEEVARSLGVWHPHFWPQFRPSRREMKLALADNRGFVWRPGTDASWRSSTTWPEVDGGRG